MENSIVKSAQYQDALKLLSDSEFDEILNVACIMGNVPIASVHFFDHDRAWKKKFDSLAIEALNISGNLEQLVQFCNSTTTIIPNISFNPDYYDHPLVHSEEKIQFFAAFPLKNELGENLGFLHLLGVDPNVLTTEQIRGLESIANLAAERLDRKVRNLLKRSQAEETLEKQTEFLNAVLENLNEGVVACDDEGKLTVFNRATREIHGLDSREDLPPERWSEHYKLFQIDGVTPFEMDQIPLRRAFSGQRVHNAEMVIENSNGNRYITSCNGNAIYDKNGKKIGAVVTMINMTEIKKVHAELIETNRALQAASAAKSEFLANMSHEIRTPLNGVLGMTEILLSTELQPEQREQLLVVHTSAENLLAIISDILDFSKIEAGKLDLEAVSFNIESLVGEVHDMLNHSASRKSLMLVKEIAPNKNLTFMGDPGRIRQIMLNLISNAIKFSEHGTIETKVSFTDAEPGKTKLRIEVRDHGVGIPVHVRSRLFQAFTQADSSTTRRFGGTGLGLSISKRLVDLMQGEIGVESEVGSGSRFWFEIALDNVAYCGLDEISNARPENLNAVSRPLRILLAEDNLVNQKIAVAMLNKLGHQAIVVGNGKAALKALENDSYDLVLMDCQMPEMDGYEATRVIRSNPSLPNNIKVIALTANAMKGDREKCLAVGMNDYVSKPLALAALQKVITRQAC